jgi:hypothetical protein
VIIGADEGGEDASCSQPHYDDEALNIYQDIPFDAVDENLANVKKQQGIASQNECAIACESPHPSNSRRHSNEYVSREDLYSTVP